MDHPNEPKPFNNTIKNQDESPAETIDRMTNALNKLVTLVDRHWSDGEQTVPIRAVYFVLSDAGFIARHTRQLMPNEQKEITNAMATDPTVKEIPKTQLQQDHEKKMEQLRQKLNLPQQPVIQPNQQKQNITPSIRP